MTFYTMFNYKENFLQLKLDDFLNLYTAISERKVAGFEFDAVRKFSCSTMISADPKIRFVFGLDEPCLFLVIAA
jgi:hypothetical protein